MSTSDFFRFLFSVYPTDTDFLLEIRPFLPPWQQDAYTFDQLKEIHASVRRWYTLGEKYLCNAAQYAQDLAESFDVYFGVLPRLGRQGSQQSVQSASCLYADVDGGDEGVEGAKALLCECELPLPDIAVKSGGGIHAYWLLKEPILLCSHAQREVYNAVLRRLARRIGGSSPLAHADMSAAECARVLRVPNTINHKRENEPRTVKTVRSPFNNEGRKSSVLPSDTTSVVPDALSYDEWRALLPREPIQKVRPHYATGPYDATGQIAPALLAWAEQGYPEGKRHHDLTGACVWLLKQCRVSPSDALALLRTKARNSPGRRAIPDAELESLVRWASR